MRNSGLSFASAKNYPPGGPPAQVAVGDMDGDGHLDILVTTQSNAANTNWNGIGNLFGAKLVGTANYESALSNNPFFWPALQHNLIWLAFLMFIASPLGMRRVSGSRPKFPTRITLFTLPAIFVLPGYATGTLIAAPRPYHWAGASLHNVPIVFCRTESS